MILFFRIHFILHYQFFTVTISYKVFFHKENKKNYEFRLDWEERSVALKMKKNKYFFILNLTMHKVNNFLYYQ